MDAGPNVVKHSYAAGQMGVGTAKMAAARAREVTVITSAFTVKNPRVAGRHAIRSRAHVQRDAQTNLVKQQCAAGEIKVTAAKEAALRS